MQAGDSNKSDKALRRPFICYRAYLAQILFAMRAVGATVSLVLFLALAFADQAQAQFSTGLVLSFERSRLTSSMAEIRKDSIISIVHNSTWNSSVANIGIVESYRISDDFSLDVEIGYSARQEYLQLTKVDSLQSLIRLPDGSDTVLVTEVFKSTKTSFEQFRAAVKTSYLFYDELRILAGVGIVVSKPLDVTHELIVPWIHVIPDSLTWSRNKVSQSTMNVLIGLSYTVTLSNTVQLIPFMRYERGIQDITDAEKSRLETIRAGINVMLVH